jgi:hypothetical protein
VIFAVIPGRNNMANPESEDPIVIMDSGPAHLTRGP